ncbi:MAG TPA: glycerol-3-phosphate 1-O-acyltransferase PlsY [Bacteroidales bacterium]|nr:glycerol-3-phosphate 1-O-acyltransferase PlsY [Bacteroidales bacterium]HPF02889.1 glycerol-3-phosphate 1-O-acyltransferase PlsY [Bacteroidales bacterium]HPJ58853.1 glycerol-3-phosphate 1-O-acyltransferase PlsY [Bacteroidales bacterium]HPR11009.1 glycerol-3-phosphate 1-O-acyltransferase PlsY [Bacteroidales bacterium]HRW84464.1 glycerol-3-phosphate 1-O-acyltransferase PlsY [Bacteroidales bacterium]
MDIFLSVTAVILAYLLGSVPTAVWAGKMLHGIDVREHGSGNAGAANAVRVLGWKTGIPVLLTDMFKGWLAAMLPVFFKISDAGTASLINLQIMTGVVAVIGHIFPVFAGLRGGKGVATVFGVLLALHPLLTLSCLVVFLIVLGLTRIISLASMSAGIAFPVLLFTLFNTPSLIFRIFSVLVAVILLVTHRNNIKRLIRGEEKKFFGKKE